MLITANEAILPLSDAPEAVSFVAHLAERLRSVLPPSLPVQASSRSGRTNVNSALGVGSPAARGSSWRPSLGLAGEDSGTDFSPQTRGPSFDMSALDPLGEHAVLHGSAAVLTAAADASGTDGLPFEFRVLEIALEAVRSKCSSCTALDAHL